MADSSALGAVLDAMHAKPQTGRIYYRGQCDYSQLTGVNFSTLKELRRSPKHYQYRLSNAREPSAAMSLGTAAHIAVLEPERFLREFCMWTERKSNGDMMPRKGPKWEAFESANIGKKVISEEEYETAITLRDAVRDDEIAMKYLAMGKPEVAMSWAHSTGLQCKGRVDWVTRVDHHPCIVDLKSTRTTDDYLFSRDCATLSYHLQLSFYADGYRAATGTLPRVVVAAVESKPPHDVVTYLVPDDVIERGRALYERLLIRLVECRATNEWPGRGNGREKVLRLPAYEMADEDEIEINWDE